MEIVRWQTPWPMVQVSDVEWVVIRDDPSRPVAIVRHLPDKPGDNYRVVRWAPQRGPPAVRVLPDVGEGRHGGDVHRPGTAPGA
jgi:hypothetical protein